MNNKILNLNPTMEAKRITELLALGFSWNLHNFSSVKHEVKIGMTAIKNLSKENWKSLIETLKN